MERYSQNGKLMRVYGKFMEEVMNDPWTAQSYYTEAMRVGLGDSILKLGDEDTAHRLSISVRLYAL